MVIGSELEGNGIQIFDMKKVSEEFKEEKKNKLATEY